MKDARFTTTRRALGVVAYGAVFAVGLPLLLALWMQPPRSDHPAAGVWQTPWRVPS